MLSRKEIKANKIISAIWDTALDGQVCEACASLHNRIFPIYGRELKKIDPPIHKGCRCRLRYVTQEEQGIEERLKEYRPVDFRKLRKGMGKKRVIQGGGQGKKKGKGCLIAFVIVFLIIVVSVIIALVNEEEKGSAPIKTETQIQKETKEIQAETEVKQAIVQEKQSPQEFFSNLTITDVIVSDGLVTISGNTDLPNGATLMVDFDVWGRSGSDLYIGVGKKTTISNGKFKTVLAIPQREEFKKGPYEVSVLFTPRGQTNRIIQLVGKDGEKLSGDLVDDTWAFKTMKIAEKKDLHLIVTPPSYTFQQPPRFPQGSAERTLAEYVTAWKEQNWSKMASFAQKTWLSTETDPTGLLAAWYDFKTLKGFEITSVEKVSNVTYDIAFLVQYEAATNQISKKQITARVIKEITAYTPSEQGQWGVNPTSAIREIDVD